MAVRLIFPFSIESIFSLLPSAETIPQDIMYAEKPMLHTGVRIINSVVNPYISESMAPEVGNSVNPMQVVMSLGTIIWIAGMIGMFVYALISYMRIKRKADVSLPVKENIYLCDYIDTPFVLGVFRPSIYLPSALAEDDKVEFVIAHEKAHIRRRDHWWKPLGFLLLTVYWFNPLIWVAYILLCRDIELACDEHVIGSLNEGEKRTYSEALLACSMRASGFHRNMISACPLAFGEVGVKDRVNAVLHYKQPAFWLVVLAVLACIVAAICFLTNPKESTDYTAVSKSYQPEEFLGMTYGDFQKITGVEAEFYHANFYTAIIPNTEITAVFLAEGWDDENAMTLLRKEDKIIRLEGKAGDFGDNFSTKMSLEEFVKDSRWSNKLLDYTIEEGAGTAYYIANQYVEIYCDMNGDSMADQMLQVALNQAGEIAPNAECWMMSVEGGAESD
ncbi:MAG: M56 family metallopeptidase [Lachnospiraceae bacterium]|nr:M56 family metallopeptidase [Lachnospiraceae bacterium]